jgi:N-acetylglucosaminyl-diphospho-decaprenol L-rhamnosyltransferase
MATMTASTIERETLPGARAGEIDLSILIVTWNSERWIERCLASIPAACGTLRYEVIVHDNASTDGTIAHILTSPRLLRSDRNVGFAGGINHTLGEASGKYVFFLNPDCELEPLALSTLHDYLESHHDIAGAVPLLIDEDGSIQREFQLRRLPSLRTFASEVLMLDKVLPSNSTTAWYRYRDLDLDAPCAIEQPAAAALLIRADVVRETGPLDEQFAPAWFEDVDYCRRLAAAGHRILLIPSARVRHFGGASLEHVPLEMFADIWYRNMWRYSVKWMPPSKSEALRWIIILGMLMRCAAAVLGLRPAGVGTGEAVRAYRGVMRRAFERWAKP